MAIITRVAESLDWPEENEVGKVTVECAGRGFLDYFRILKATGEDEDKAWGAEIDAGVTCQAASKGEADEDATEDDTPSFPLVDLFSLSETELNEIDYYKVLHLPCRPTITPDDVKKAYRKSCLKYHPDKSGRGEEDAVFLKVKAAFETLSTQKMAYDSTEMPFDDSIPSDREIAKKDFFKLWEPVFQRNLHFDSRLLCSKINGGNKRNNRRSSGASRNSKNKNKKMQGPPSIGDINTPIEEVHEYYDYWIHFESWRDFSLQAARELETEEHLENAESRYEKRWYQKEIDRAAKKLKQQEVARITVLVEKAMASDPRLIQEKKRLIEEKAKKQQQKKQDALDKKQAEEAKKQAEQQKLDEEKKRKSEEKLAREQEKKKLRKAKQAFKKCVSAALEELQQKEYALEDEVDVICAELDRSKLTKLNSNLEGKSASQVVTIVKKRSESIKNGLSEVDEDENEDEDPNNSETTKKTPQEDIKAQPLKVTSTPTKKKQLVFSKEEMTALAKGAKKFPPGGANRWDQISNYINNVCRPQNPRTKEECIEIFNRTNKSAKSYQNNSKTEPSVTASTKFTSDDNSSGWTQEQDQQLQKGLSEYPSSMEKNERWSKITNGVTGKTKKECVTRFKEIRNALKAKK